MKLLLTDGETHAALAVVRSLGGAHEVHVAASDPRRSLAGASHHAAAAHTAPDPLSDPEGFANELATLADKHDAGAILPVTDAAMAALLRGRTIPERVRLVAPAPTAYQRLSDKAGLADLAARHGLAMPEGAVVASAGGARTLATELGWPVVVKPTVSVTDDAPGGRRKPPVLVAADAAALDRAWPAVAGQGAALVQRYVPGRGEGLFVLRAGGRIRAAFAHRRLREKPPAGGVSTLRESIAVDPARLRAVAVLLDELDYEGVAMAEFRVNGPHAWLLEFNARLWGSLQLAIDAGVDFPRLMLDALEGRLPDEMPRYRVGVRSRWLLGDLDHAIALARGARDPEGRTGVGAVLRVLFGRNGPDCRFEVLRRDDPRPFRVELAAWLRDALRRS